MGLRLVCGTTKRLAVTVRRAQGVHPFILMLKKSCQQSERDTRFSRKKKIRKIFFLSLPLYTALALSIFIIPYP